MGVPPGSRKRPHPMAERIAAARVSSFHLRGFAAAFRAFKRDEQAFHCKIVAAVNIEHSKERKKFSAVRVLAERRLNLLQLRSFGRVFNDPAFQFQLVADRVGAFEILGLFCEPILASS
jgi:hypothetical protein